MTPIIKRFASLLFAITLPFIGLGQDRAVAEYMCHEFNGELNNDKTPVALKHRYSKTPFTCIIKNSDSLSIYDQAKNLISNNKQWKTTWE